MADLDALRALLDQATPGPWEPGEGFDTCVYGPRQGPRDNGCVADCYGEPLANAQLIAALRNLAPELLTVAEAARERDRCGEECRAMQPYRGCTCGDEVMRAALDALNARIQEVLG